jgi:hypothetical protein
VRTFCPRFDIKLAAAAAVVVTVFGKRRPSLFSLTLHKVTKKPAVLSSTCAALRDSIPHICKVLLSSGKDYMHNLIYLKCYSFTWFNNR